VLLQITGADAVDVFRDEAGGHRWQRVPPTEKRGRVQTSTVTVAVLPEPVASAVVIQDRDLDWKFCRASGHGGQHLQKTDSAVQLTHKPTKIMVRCQNERSQYHNKIAALAVLRARLWDRQRASEQSGRAADRRQQVGSGMRGDKRRTIRVRDGVVTDHVLNRQWPLGKYLNGDW
jgi:peptide chain release factor 1